MSERGNLSTAIIITAVAAIVLALVLLNVRSGHQSPTTGNKCDLGRAAGMPDLDCGPGRHMTEEARGDVCHRECVDSDANAHKIGRDSGVAFSAPPPAQEIQFVEEGVVVGYMRIDPLRLTLLKPVCLRVKGEDGYTYPRGGGWLSIGGPAGCPGSDDNLCVDDDALFYLCEDDSNGADD